MYDSQDPQIHEILYLGSDSVPREVNPKAQVYVGVKTVRQFSTN